MYWWVEHDLLKLTIAFIEVSVDGAASTWCTFFPNYLARLECMCLVLPTCTTSPCITGVLMVIWPSLNLIPLTCKAGTGTVTGELLWVMTKFLLLFNAVLL